VHVPESLPGEIMEQALGVGSEWRGNHNDFSTCRENWARQRKAATRAPAQRPTPPSVIRVWAS